MFLRGLGETSSARLTKYGRLKWILVATATTTFVLLNICPSVIASDATEVIPQLVVRAGESLTGGYGSVVFSPDGRFVALQATDKLIVFDLKWNTEIIRIHLASAVFARRIVFPSHGNVVFVEDGPTLSKCELDRQQPCSVLVDDASDGSAFAISENDRWLAYLDKAGSTELVDLANPKMRTQMAPPESGLKEYDRAWIFAVFSPNSEFLGVVRLGRHALVFQVSSRSHVPSRLAIHGDAADVSFNSQQHLIASLLVPSNDQGKASEAFSIVDVSSQRTIIPTTKGYHPRIVRHASAVVFTLNQDSKFWTRSELRLIRLPSGRSEAMRELPASPFEIQVSPDARRVVYSESVLSQSSTSGSVLESEVASKGPPIILVGPTSRATDIDFLGPYDTIVAHDSGTRLWSLFGGTPIANSVEISFSADGKIGAYFSPGPDRNELMTFDIKDFKASKSGSALSKDIPTANFALSHDGSRLIWWRATKLVVWDRKLNTITDLPCETHGLSFGVISTNFRPHLSPSGNLVGAYCYSDSGKSGGDVRSSYQIKLMVWNVDTLTKVATIDAEQFTDTFAFSPDDRMIALAGESIKMVHIDDGTSFILGPIPDNKLKPIPLSRKTTTSLVFSYRYPALVVATDQSNGPPFSTIEVWDLNSRTKEDIPQSTHIGALATSHGDTIAALNDDGSIALYQSLRDRPAARLIGIGDRDWLVVAPNGLFDGTADAMKWVGWRLREGSPVLSLDLFFDDLFHPGLLAEIARGKMPALPGELGISVFLAIPGLQTMLRQDLITPKTNSLGNVVLCFNARNAFSALETLVGRGPESLLRESDERDCPLSAVLPRTASADSILKSLEELKSSHLSTMWDGTIVRSIPGAVLHVLTAAVSDYPAESGLGKTPTSVAAATMLRQIVQQKNQSSKLFSETKLWNSSEYCGPLSDADATRSSIINCLDKIAISVRSEDAIILFFSGHGLVPENQEMFYFMPFDSTMDTAAQTGISSALFTEKLRSLAARRIVLIIDACQSGAALDSLSKAAESKAALEKEFQETERANGKPMLDHTVGVAVIAATLPFQVGGGDANSNAFEDAILEGLKSKGQSPDNEVRVSDLIRHVRDAGTKSVTGYTPLAIHVGADFSIAVSK